MQNSEYYKVNEKELKCKTLNNVILFRSWSVQKEIQFDECE
jgi:hypothetical protein